MSLHHLAKEYCQFLNVFRVCLCVYIEEHASNLHLHRRLQCFHSSTSHFNRHLHNLQKVCQSSPWFLMRHGCRLSSSFVCNGCIVVKQCEIESMLLLITNRKSHTLDRAVATSYRLSIVMFRSAAVWPQF